MNKKITYKGREYEIEIKWAGLAEAYCVRVVDLTTFSILPKHYLYDINLFKSMLVEIIENERKGDLDIIEMWDGKL